MRRISRTIMVEATIDLSKIDDDDLIAELQDRHLAGDGMIDELGWIRRAVADGRKSDALSLIDRLMMPKFKTIDECKAAERARFDYLFCASGRR
jgi:hypothetical protein